jgi:hypothetical protein
MQDALHHMTHWLEKAVIGLNLCPFAKAVHVKGQIHWVISDAQDDAEVLSILQRELNDLQGLSADVRDTTLIVLPHAFADFYDFNDFLGRAERLLKKLKLEGEFQIASFHPQFVFADADEDDITNATNRAPYPTLHLLREASVDRAVAAFPQAQAIFENNMHTLENLGAQGWQQLMLGAQATGSVDEKDRP